MAGITLLLLSSVMIGHAFGQTPSCHLFDDAFYRSTTIFDNYGGTSNPNREWKLSTAEKPDFTVPENNDRSYFWRSDYSSYFFITLVTRMSSGVTSKTTFTLKYFMKQPNMQVIVYFDKLAGLEKQHSYSRNVISTFTPNATTDNSNSTWKTLTVSCSTSDGRYCCGKNESETCSGQFYLEFPQTWDMYYKHNVAVADYQINGGDCSGKKSIRPEVPVIVVQPQNTSIYKGSTGRLDCLLDTGLYSCFHAAKDLKVKEGTPICQERSNETHCYWTKNGAAVSPDGNRYSFVKNDYIGDCSITISNASLSLDAGMWQCVVAGKGTNTPVISSQMAKLTVMRREGTLE